MTRYNGAQSPYKLPPLYSTQATQPSCRNYLFLITSRLNCPNMVPKIAIRFYQIEGPKDSMTGGGSLSHNEFGSTWIIPLWPGTNLPLPLTGFKSWVSSPHMRFRSIIVRPKVSISQHMNNLPSQGLRKPYIPHSNTTKFFMFQ